MAVIPLCPTPRAPVLNDSSRCKAKRLNHLRIVEARAAEYWSFAAAIAHDLDPADSIMMLLVKDMVDHSLEIRKLRRHKTQLSVLAKLKMNGGLPPKSIKHNETYFATAHGEADLFIEDLDTFAAIDRLLGLAEDRRMAVLKEIERYRKALAERLRERSDNAILAGEFSAAASGPDIDGTKTDRIANTDAAKGETDGTKPLSDPPDPIRS
jgi:hypothetical protein